MHATHPTTHRLLAASIFAASVALARDVAAQSLPPFPHAVPPADTASLIDFQVDGGPHTVTILPRGTELDVGSHATDCAADCRLRLAPGRYILLVARAPEGPRYARGFRVRTDSMLVHASSPQSMTPAHLLAGTGVVVGAAERDHAFGSAHRASVHAPASSATRCAPRSKANA